MKKEEDRLTLLHRVATLFYLEGKHKNEIARIVKQSTTQVALLIKEAQQKRIVEIKVNVPQFQVLQEKLRSRFHHLRDVIVVPHNPGMKSLLADLSQTAAEYFDTHVAAGSKVAMGGGYLMYEMVNLLTERPRDIDIYAGAIVGRGPTIVHIDPMVVTTLLWAKSGHMPGRAHYVTVTPMGHTRRAVQDHYRQLVRKKEVTDLIESLSKVDWLFASLGSLNADEGYVSTTSSTTRNLLDEMNFDDTELKREGVVGDIVYSYFDENGRGHRTWDLVGSLGLRRLKQMAADPKSSVVVVVGSYKLQALRAVLRGKLCNVLITDAEAAERLTNEAF